VRRVEGTEEEGGRGGGGCAFFREA